VAQPNGVIDVFWHGSADDHLWHGQYTPGQGWSGPQRLGGDLHGAPEPVENKYGTVEVFWEGGGPARSLFRVTRYVGQGWSAPENLGLGPLGGAPRATALPGGAVDVVWRGSTLPHDVWSAYLRSGSRARGPVDLGGPLRGSPWPAAAGWSAGVFFRGDRGKLWELPYRPSGRWRDAVKVKVGPVGSAPYAAAGMGGGPFEVFWNGVGGGLWTATGAGRSWHGPQRVVSRARRTRHRR
jgi:hypothetical protein